MSSLVCFSLSLCISGLFPLIFISLRLLNANIMKGLLIFFSILFCFACQKKKAEIITTEQTIEVNQPPVVGLEIGNKAPDLYLKDTDNVFVQLSTINNKMILIDFWASWCAPCRIENIHLKTVYTTFKDTTFKTCKGFDIYSVSSDPNHTAWKNCLKNESYNWKYNLIDISDWNKTGSYLYNIKAIPMNFLIDNNGIIVAKNLRDTMVEKTLIQYLK